MKRVDKILGADVELGNILQCRTPACSSTTTQHACCLPKSRASRGHRTASTSSYESHYAGRAYSGAAAGHADGYDPQDWGRKFLDTTGGCFYIDLGHLEACIPEVRSARAFVAAHHANLRLARGPACARTRSCFPGERIVVMANNSDRMGNSWGGHLNVLVSRDLWTQVFVCMGPALVRARGISGELDSIHGTRQSGR